MRDRFSLDKNLEKEIVEMIYIEGLEIKLNFFCLGIERNFRRNFFYLNKYLACVCKTYFSQKINMKISEI